MIIDQRTFQLFTYDFFFIWSNFPRFRDINHRITLFAIKKHFGFHFFYDSRSIYSMMFEYNEKELNGYHTCTYFVLQSRNTKQCF